ncbi:MAG: hypothetical protein ACQESE_03575 [Nanobdellota archaeon]
MRRSGIVKFVATAAVTLASYLPISAEMNLNQDRSREEFSSIGFLQDTIETNINLDVEALEKKVRECSFCNNNAFKLKYARLVQEEELYKAKEIVETRYFDAQEMSNEKVFMKDYYEDIHKRLKLMNNYYQDMLSDEKTFKNEFNRSIGENGFIKAIFHEPDSKDLQEGMSLVLKSIHYTELENTGIEANYLEHYKNKLKAWIIDDTSTLDIKKMTRNSRQFSKSIEKIIEQDSIPFYEKAVQATRTCITYDSLLNTNVSGMQFKRTMNMLSSRIVQKQQLKNEYDEMNTNLQSEQDNSISLRTLRSDTLNPTGIYQYGNKILVIIDQKAKKSNYYGEISSRASPLRPSLGAFIASAGAKLSQYVQEIEGDRFKPGKYHDMEIPQDPRLFEGCIIPYFVDRKQKPFLKVNNDTYQARIVFSSIKNQRYTEKFREEYLPLVTVKDFEGKVYERIHGPKQITRYYELANEHRVEYLNDDTLKVYIATPEIIIRTAPEDTVYRKESPKTVYIDVLTDEKKAQKYIRSEDFINHPEIFNNADKHYREIRTNVLEYVKHQQ